ncbi:hypothetical protein ABTY23_30355, partial [Streptomyces sp. NPDC096068]
ALVLDGVIQRRDKPDPATFIGSGKARELRSSVGKPVVAVACSVRSCGHVPLEHPRLARAVDRVVQAWSKPSSSPVLAPAGRSGGVYEARAVPSGSGRTAPSRGFAARGETFTFAPGRGAWTTRPSPR